MRTLIINFKNYPQALGAGSVKLAKTAAKVAADLDVEVIVAPPNPMLALVASKVEIGVFSQSVASVVGDKTTGSVLPEAVKGAGATGTILNHSESRLPRIAIETLVPRLKKLRLDVCLCARSSTEAASLAGLKTEYIAVEPPALIGSGVAVSTAKPRLVSNTVAAARSAGYRGKILCGAGIVSGDDVRRAVELGADGVLVASSVVKDLNWAAKIRELARSLC
ncbi:MAG: triose-phosphate isomerase [Nitrososphaerales archaeon]|nr:triose-phosphate isomerase [Nitrososphaerales archaeon]